jgi:hypothetical protein
MLGTVSDIEVKRHHLVFAENGCGEKSIAIIYD